MRIASKVAVLLLAALYGHSNAQETFKCKINGNIVYQDRPCPGSVRYSDSLPPQKPKGPAVAPANSGTEQTQTSEIKKGDIERQKSFLDARAKERKISDLRSQIVDQEASIAMLHQRMANELAALDEKASTARNNLAGATFLQSVATERQAVTSRYDIEISTQRERLKQLREDLARASKD